MGQAPAAHRGLGSLGGHQRVEVRGQVFVRRAD